MGCFLAPRRPVRLLAVPALALCLAFGAPCRAEEASPAALAARAVRSDFGNFYFDGGNLIRLGAGLGAAAIVANTNADRYLRDRYQEDVRSGGTDDAARIAKVPGTALVTVPVYAVSYGAGLLLRNPTMEDWAQRSFRATLTGAPALLLFQEAIGSDRPADGDSRWRPFQSSHGVSGHAFIGAIPWITAAKMTENVYAKGALYGLSTLTALSRINDDAHYTSQAALGWYLAYLSCDAVWRTEKERETKTGFGIAPVRHGVAVTFHREF